MGESNCWPYTAGAQISRRRAVRGGLTALAGIAGAALVGCAAEQEAPPARTPAVEATPTPTPSPAPDARASGALRDAGLGPIAGVDPHGSLYQGAGIVRQVYLNLVRYEMVRPDLDLHYELAERHEVPDETTYVFHLRGDAMIQPNDRGIPERPMDAEDVLASFDRIRDPVNAATGFPFFARWIASYDAPDTRTVRMTTRGPYAWMLAVLGDSLQGAMAPRELLALPREAMREDAVGAGPFMVHTVQEGRGFTLQRHPNFFEDGRPYLDAYRRVLFQDVVTLYTAFGDRQVDVIGIPDAEAARELVRQNGDVTHVEHGSLAYNSFWMRTDTSPWADERVRRAMNLAMDRQEYIDLIGRGAGQPMGPIAPALGPYVLPPDELDRLQPHDPDEARSLFEAAGVSEMRFVYPVSDAMPDYVELMARQLQEVGVLAVPEPLDPLAWFAGYFRSTHTASFSLNQAYKTPDAALLWYRSGGPTGGGHFATGHSSEALDRLIDGAAAAVDADERVELYHEAQREVLASDPAFINVFNVEANTLFYDNIRGLSPGPGHMGEFLYRHAWIDA